MELSEAFELLHIDQDSDDFTVATLVHSIPSYIKQVTGLTTEEQKAEPLCSVLSSMLLNSWYYGSDTAADRTIEHLIKTIGLNRDSQPRD